MERDQRSAGGAGRRSSFDPAVAAFSLLKIEEGFEQAGAVEVRPEDIGDKDLGVGDLPQKEVADTHLTASADKKVGVRKIGGVEIASELLLGDGRRSAIGVAIMTPALGEERVHGIDNLGAASVVEGDGKNHAGVAGRGLDSITRVFLDGERQIVGAPKEPHTNVVALDQRHLVADVLAEQFHEEFNFRFGAAPVFDREGVERKGLDVEPSTRFDGSASGLGARAVANDAREVALLRPAPVAVHDDGDMAGKARDIQFFEKTRLFCGDWTEGIEHQGLREGAVVRVGHGENPNPLYAAKLTQR